LETVKQSNALPTTPSSLMQDGCAPKILREDGLYLVMNCPVCGQEYHYPRSKYLLAQGRMRPLGQTCTKSCARKRWHLLHPGKSFFNVMLPEQRGKPSGPKTPEHRAKLSAVAKSKGHRPVLRKGNGTGMTASEQLISEVLPVGWVWNYPVALGGRQQGFPTSYKLDFAWPEMMIGLEVDGNSHTATARQAQDRKKEKKLTELGWSVFRISNATVQSMSITLKLKEHLTTLLGIIG
jgi:hypothetical protein